MNILAARKYPTPRNGPLSLEETETRRLAYAIKNLASPLLDFDTAAREMAELITGPCWLVPIPDSTGNTDANARLAHHIARYVDGAQIAKAIYRTQPVQSQCARHKHALGPISPEQHHLARTRKMLTLRQTPPLAPLPPAQPPLPPPRKLLPLPQPFFGNNATPGETPLDPPRLALGFGAGLVFADAAPRRIQLQATLL